ncbi:protein-tyrosine phosphatase-like protein [Apiospora hydei]|uniref:Protein-tyrosine phosphatase-like protein n=1 Tax=Apiospora hydei TaxID=1337664 RepID=A0ABR1VB83_9PEZI
MGEMDHNTILDNVQNFRDVGQTVNTQCGKRVLTPSTFEDDASPEDRRKLKDEYGIKTVIDLRTKTEHVKQAEKRQADLKVPALLQSNAALAEPVQIPGLRYLEIKITGGKFEKFLISQLSWLGFFKLIFLYTLGQRIAAIRIMSQEVMLPRGLVGMGLDTLDHSGADILEALNAFLEPPPAPASTSGGDGPSLPILVHCTQGKDRTGLIVALVLMTLGVPLEAISHDYLLTQQALEADRETRIAEIEEIGLTPDWGDCPPDFVARIHDHLESQYGGVAAYLDSMEFGSDKRRRLVEVLGA